MASGSPVLYQTEMVWRPEPQLVIEGRAVLDEIASADSLTKLTPL
jgi:hypothetical protein